jgi:hypothetical protein
MIWTGSAGVVRLANQGIAPNGTNTMDLVTFPVAGNSINQTNSVTSGISYTFSIWLATQSGTQTVEIGNINSGVYETVTVTTTPQRFEVTQVASSATRYPAIRATATYSILVWGAQLETGVTATEYIPTTSVIRTKFAGITQDGGSASNIARLDYTNATCPSILVEPQRTNLVLRSDLLNTSPWAILLSEVSINENFAISPDGTQNANKINFLTGNTRFTQSISVSQNTTYTLSFYVKNIDATQVSINIGSTNLPITNYFSQISTTEWKRVSFTFTTNTGVTVISPQITRDGTIGKSLLIYGAQMEAGANATSYIPTVASTVTRNADVISKTGISSLIGQTEGTLYAEFNTGPSNTNSGARTILSISDGTVANRIEIYIFNNLLYYDHRVSSMNQGGGLVTTITTFNTNMKIALSYKLNSVKFFINGILVNTDLTALIPTCSVIGIGTTYSSTSQYNGLISDVLLFKTQLTDQECINLTTL